eukprot:767157-Hanusia_phi.AAC.3
MYLLLFLLLFLLPRPISSSPILLLHSLLPSFPPVPVFSSAPASPRAVSSYIYPVCLASSFVVSESSPFFLIFIQPSRHNCAGTLELDGALVVRAAPGAKVVIQSLLVNNAGERGGRGREGGREGGRAITRKGDDGGSRMEAGEGRRRRLHAR